MSRRNIANRKLLRSAPDWAKALFLLRTQTYVNARRSDVLPYNYKVYWGTLPLEKLIGCEIELGIINEEDYHRVAKTLNDLQLVVNRTPAFKYDGSVGWYGGEIVSPPMPANKEGIDDICDMIEDIKELVLSNISYQTGNQVGAGMHIHVSRTYMRGDKNYEVWGPAALIALMRLMPGLFKLTGRKDNGYQKYPMDILLEEGDIIENLIRHMKNNRNCAVNAFNLRGTGGTTVEFRIFEATFNTRIIKSRLQFVDVLTDILADNNNDIETAAKITWGEIKKKATQKKYNELVEFINDNSIREVNSLVPAVIQM